MSLICCLVILNACSKIGDLSGKSQPSPQSISFIPATGTNSNTKVNAVGDTIKLEHVNSTSDDTFTEFSAGRSKERGLIARTAAANSLKLSSSWNLSLVDSSIKPTYLAPAIDQVHGLLYSGAFNHGVDVIDTKNTASPTDDVYLGKYSTASAAALPGNGSEQVAVDPANNLVYVSTWNGGLSVIDMKGTATLADDVVLFTYTTASTPSLTDNRNFGVQIGASGKIYLVGLGGVMIIDRNATPLNFADDIVTSYTPTSTPALPAGCERSLSVDPTEKYIACGGSIAAVIDTQQTSVQADDVILAAYTTTSTPSVTSDFYAYSVAFDAANKILYAASRYQGLAVFSTQGTSSLADDVLSKPYTTSSSPALSNNSASALMFHQNYLYVGSYVSGADVIDTKGTASFADDELVTRYSTKSSPSLVDDSVSCFLRDPTSNLLIFCTESGLTAVALGSPTYSLSSYFYSAIQSLGTVADTLLSFDFAGASSEVSLQSRVGTASAFEEYEFNDGTPAESVGDYYGWGGAFTSASEGGGTIKLTNPSASPWSGRDYVYSWLDFGLAANHFPLGTIVSARIRVNIANAAANPSVIFFSGQWDDSIAVNTDGNWQIVSFVGKSSAFQNIGFAVDYNSGSWNNATDSVEIDWVRFEQPDSAWGAWSTACTDPLSCSIGATGGNSWIQYRLAMNSASQVTSPEIFSVTYSDGYQPSGTFTSANFSLSGGATKLVSFSADVNAPAGTMVSFEYSTDNGTTWTAMSSSQTFVNIHASSFKWRAMMATTDPLKTPTVKNAVLNVK